MRRLFSVPAWGVDGREFSLLCLMTEAQLIEMARMCKFVVRVDFAAEVIAIHPADDALIASLEAESHKESGGTLQ